MASGWGAPDGAGSRIGGRLTADYLTVISTETQWSGEISLLNGAGRIKVGDLSAQSYNRALILFSSYRFRAPLEMTCEAARPGPRSSAEDVACSLFLATSS